MHDAVRPLVTPQIIEKVIAGARRSKAALAACPSKDTVKLANAKGFIQDSPARETVWLAQTPQIFERRFWNARIGKGKRRLRPMMPSWWSVWGVRVKLVESPPENIKVTVPSDLEPLASIFFRSADMTVRIGIGYDIHRLKKGRPLWLGGIQIPFEQGLDGHSDADALLHAITDALLGAAGLPDIGHYFPPSDPTLKNIASA